MTRTHYYKRHPRGFANEYDLLALPAGQDPPSDWHRGERRPWERISREDALVLARRDSSSYAEYYVTVTPRADGADAFSQYAKRYPDSLLAMRIERERYSMEVSA